MTVQPTALDVEQDRVIQAITLSQWINPERTWQGVTAESGSGRVKLYVFISESGHTYSVRIDNMFTDRQYIFGLSSIAECVNIPTDSSSSDILSRFMPSHAIGMLQ